MSMHKCLESVLRRNKNAFKNYKKVFADKEAMKTLSEFSRELYVDKTIDVDENGKFFIKAEETFQKD